MAIKNKENGSLNQVECLSEEQVSVQDIRVQNSLPLGLRVPSVAH